jgi:outer membrane protein OmpA-like peptidoglycan-associated protein
MRPIDRKGVESMGISRMMALGLIVTTAGLTGCKNSLKTENESLHAEVQQLRDQLAERNSALENCNSELRSRDQQLAEVRRDMGVSGNTGFENIPGVTGSASAGEVTASVESDLLFDSGKTTLKSAAKQSLDAVAGVLNSTYGSAHIRIAGHTDTDPIRKSGFKSNYHLGFERAFAVRDYLVSKGVAASRLSLASHGPDIPRGSDKKHNRRVEIVVVLGGGTIATASAQR